MADKTIRISELPSSGSNTAGLYTIGVNASNESVKVPLGDILASAHGEVMFADLDKLCTADDMLQGKPACYTVLDTLVSTKGTVTLKVGVLWVYSDNLRHVVMQVLNTNFVLDDDGTFTGRVHNHDVHEYSRTYAYSTAAGTLHTWSKWQEVGGKGIVDRITNVALAKQNKLTAGDKATRIGDDAILATKQIYKGTVINTNAVPTLAVGAYCFNTATKKLYVGAQHGNAVVTDTVPMPDDFLFVDTASGTTYRCDGATLNNIANIKTVNGHSLLGGGDVQLTGADFLLENGAGRTINEAVNSNTEALQNKLDKASIVQTTGTATDKVMSQKSVTDALDFPRVTLKLTYLTEVIKGKYMNGGGNLVNSPTHCTTCHIPCEGVHKVELLSGDTKDWNYIVAFDKDNKVVANAVAYNNSKKYALTTPATTTYVVAGYLADTTNDRGVWIDGVKLHEPVPDDIEIKHEGGDKEYYLMSQKGVQDYVNQRLMDSAQSHSSFGSGFCYRLNARQIELLEASDVITLEICAQCNGGLNGYNNTAAMGYFSIMFGNNHGALTTSYDGKLSYSSDQKKYGQGSGYTYAVDGAVLTCWDRFIVVINRKTGVIRLYDKCSRLVAEKQREEYKSDTWLAGDDWLSITSRNVQDIWAIRIYDRVVEPMKYNGNIIVADSNFVEAILPFQYPSNVKAVQVQDYAFTYKNAGAPYTWPKARAYDSADGLLTGTNDTTDWLAVGATDNVSNIANMHVREVDFEVSGKWRVYSVGRIHVYSCVNSEGVDMGINGYYEMTKTSAEMPAGRYTMKFVSNWPCDFADIAAGTTIKHYGAKIHILHCVANINPRYYCNMQCWDDARGEWWTPLDVKNHETPVVPTFSDAAWRSVPAPALLSQPSFNGQLKIDDSGKVYVGVCVGATRTWKQINNT